MARDRRILLVPAALLVALVGLLSLSSAWRERADSRRAARSPLEGRASDRSPDEDAPGSAAAAPGEAGTQAEACIHGVVKGTMGVLWGARVVAYRSEGGEVMAEAWTGPEGLYSLAVEPGVEFDLSIEPAPETGLMAARHVGILLASREERVEDVALDTGATVRGRLVDADGKGRGGIELIALRPGALTGIDETKHPSAFVGRADARGQSGDDGAFRLRGLAEGSYALIVRDPDWMFPAPVSVRTDGPEVSLVVVPALAVDLLVKDIETDQPIPAFSVRARLGERVLLEGAGTAGVFSTRMRLAGPLERPYVVLLEVAAAGFVPADPIMNSSRRGQVLWLLPCRDPNTTVRVSFDDGQPYRGELVAIFSAKVGAGAGRVRFERVRQGVYRGALPYGRWDVVLFTVGEKGFEAEAAVTRDSQTELALVLPAGGTLMLLPPAGADGCSAWLRSADDAQQYRNGTMIAVPREGARLEGILPGLYKVGYARATEHSGRVFYDTVWFRDVRVVVGGTEEIVMPDEAIERHGYR